MKQRKNVTVILVFVLKIIMFMFFQFGPPDQGTLQTSMYFPTSLGVLIQKFKNNERNLDNRCLLKKGVFRENINII